MKKGITLAEVAMSLVIVAIAVALVTTGFLRARENYWNTKKYEVVAKVITKYDTQPVSRGYITTPEWKAILGEGIEAGTTKISLPRMYSRDNTAGSIHMRIEDDKWVLYFDNNNPETCKFVRDMINHGKTGFIMEYGEGSGSYHEKSGWASITSSHCRGSDSDFRIRQP